AGRGGLAPRHRVPVREVDRRLLLRHRRPGPGPPRSRAPRPLRAPGAGRHRRRCAMSHGRFPFDYDGLIGEGWSGPDPNGAHVNVVLAERGTPTAAALLTTFTAPAPGHAPILVVVGEDKAHYEPVWPPTIMINKATATEELHQQITWGAGQLGIAQGVLDAVAAELIPLTGDLLVFVAIYIDPGA